MSVSYPVFTSSARSLKNKLLSRTTGGRVAGKSSRYAEIQALENVSFRFEPGDRVALIGHNGSGKSTLLRVMAGIYHPASGSMHVEGRVAALFDTAFGMDQESTGYENILLRGLYLGLTRAEIESQADDIAEFTELGEFLDMPIRTYSAGMVARLAFAISTAVNADVLLVDEGIGAGDAAFVAKANKRLIGFIERAPIVVLSSHDPSMIKKFCTRGLVLQRGKLLFDGPIEDAYEHYDEVVGASISS
ncbi:ABC transporter ATP-binding protein [Microvirga pudoricolor]|uniref:ABC transporter ATP-binding protein n=1 Tax=Microvirga pudoricolor TaxID=2778729 RepID=UPI001951E08C|nr:ABC transporter ATP-binding protein [Microvirga pudoricolor]MBM6596242.1 ABC transporter ATP-binding protein [Microvirga pudoricolor]